MWMIVTTASNYFTVMDASLGLRQRICEPDSQTFYERRIVVRDGSVKIVRRSTLKDTLISHSWLPDWIVSLTGHWSLQFIIFESNSHLARIESEAFSNSSLQSIFIPKNVELLGSRCFYTCKSLSSITFESNSRLARIESEAFSNSSLQSILSPSNVEVLESKCFSGCNSLSSITFDTN
jgi:hypothetical protein